MMVARKKIKSRIEMEKDTQKRAERGRRRMTRKNSKATENCSRERERSANDFFVIGHDVDVVIRFGIFRVYCDL